MFYKIKVILLRIITVSILFFVLWIVIQKVSPTINPPLPSTTSVQRDYRGAIDIDIKQPFSEGSKVKKDQTKTK